MLRLLLMVTAVGCAAPTTSREGRVLDALAEDNYAWALRDPRSYG